MSYESPRPVDRETAERILAGTDIDSIQATLISLSLSGTDRSWVEAETMRLTEHPAYEVRAIAATALGHLARIYHETPPGAFRALARLREDPRTRPYADSALEDIHQALPR